MTLYTPHILFVSHPVKVVETPIKEVRSVAHIALVNPAVPTAIPPRSILVA